VFTLRWPYFILTREATLLTNLAREFQACVHALTVITGSGNGGNALVVFDYDSARNAVSPSGRMDLEAPKEARSQGGDVF